MSFSARSASLGGGCVGSLGAWPRATSSDAPGTLPVAASSIASSSEGDGSDDFFLVVGALVVFLYGALLAARRLAKIHKIRLVSTSQPPELTLARGLTWHLFNSHIWSTGQDAVAVIKNELKLLLPGVSVFLDVRS